MTKSASSSFDPSSIQRPDSALMTYYLLTAAMTIVGFPFVIIPLWLRYITLKYHFDDKGVSMSVGILFHREVYLTYRRIQDIHVTRNLFHRWLGLAAVAIQTASGSSSAEMTVEGIREPEKLRDFLYLKMRGARGETAERASSADSAGESASGGTVAGEPIVAETDEALVLLRSIRDELRRWRVDAESSDPRGRGGSP